MDATLGWPCYTYDALKDAFVRYMPKWPPSGLSYPTLVLGDEHSALVAFTDTPELFGGEIRILAAIDIMDGKIIRWIDYWDGRHFRRGAGGQDAYAGGQVPHGLQGEHGPRQR